MTYTFFILLSISFSTSIYILYFLYNILVKYKKTGFSDIHIISIYVILNKSNEFNNLEAMCYSFPDVNNIIIIVVRKYV